MTRRWFISLFGALAALPLVKLRPSVPVLYGDGVHDDADALQAWVDGKPVVWSNGQRVGPDIVNRTFLLGKSIDMSRGDGRSLMCSSLQWTDGAPTSGMFYRWPSLQKSGVAGLPQ